MGFRQAAVLSTVSFFLGVLFICFTVDHRLLYTELTQEAIQDGFIFYTTFFNAPPAIKALLHAMVGVGVVGLISKLHKWDDSAMFFDGTSLAAYVFGIAVYITVTIPTLRTIVTPVVGVDTDEDRAEALRVLSAGNTIIILCLGAILALQAGQVYARRAEARELAKIRETEKQKEQQAAVGTDKKDQ
ncbi:hypothetical protein PC9H_006309 [Pleurotus ostreatus]|uniref:Shr3 amino acid permease chaperone n=3 Tax=Pleurotus TaxID=5320 RepID=A0A067NFW4_PLEO1|nr:uncharacterized protein PC9H_006309 [Pleurotus ostreatus]KAF7430601.1 hypothetical protein PC9H_006309 [Pleurotus ostreatus]KAG9223799.1 hypothetical protein CCMSSC00406_0004860 [Pleurotus cornucopiae]KAJ8694902.1 Protein csh3 [Pleurotus ostreatus]KDQ26923.1 hypothetical protein PLEOSDRAFT_1113272 [Pleurotus ostreatus PC15]